MIAIDPKYQGRALIGQTDMARAGEIYVQRLVEGLGPESVRSVRRGDLDWTLCIDRDLTDIADLVWTLVDAPVSRLVTCASGDIFVDPVVGIADAGLLRAQRPDLDITVRTLIACADTALAQAMKVGTREAVYEIGQVDAFRRNSITEVQLARSAPDDFQSAYQPIFAVGGSAPSGYEALVRWRHGGRIVQPPDFIDQAESSSLIVPIGRAIIERAVAALAAQNSDDLFISVNLSPRQLADRRLVSTLLSIVDAHGLRPERVWVEINEDSVIGLGSPEQRTVEALGECGFVVCVDDLGAGYSALSYLRDLPIRAVKIDQSIVSRLTVSAVDRQLVQAIKTMIAGQGILSVAEGVETPEVYEVVADLGLDFIQGYLLGRPGPGLLGRTPPSGDLVGRR